MNFDEGPISVLKMEPSGKMHVDELLDNDIQNLPTIYIIILLSNIFT